MYIYKDLAVDFRKINYTSTCKISGSTELWWCCCQKVAYLLLLVSCVQLTMRPGQTMQIGLTALDQFGNPTHLIARVLDKRPVTNLGPFSQAKGTNSGSSNVSKLYMHVT